jgi:hypothetical protein
MIFSNNKTDFRKKYEEARKDNERLEYALVRRNQEVELLEGDNNRLAQEAKINRSQYLETKKEFEEKDIEVLTEKYVAIREANEKLAPLVEENTQLKIENAQAFAKIEMLEKMVDINGDVLDVKDLVDKLVGKMPSLEKLNFNVSVDQKVAKK